MRPGHLSVRVVHSSRRSEDIVQKSRIALFSTIIIIIITETKTDRHTDRRQTGRQGEIQREREGRGRQTD